MKFIKNIWLWIGLLIIVIGLGVILVLYKFRNYLPFTTKTTVSNGYTCTREHIWLPLRLKFKGCRTITGTIVSIKHEPDGDYHALLRLDWQYQLLLTAENYTKKSGNLVIEDVCFYPPDEIAAKSACKGYKSPFSAPVVGQHYEITGNYVLDRLHGGWAEIHGLSQLKQIQ